MYGNVRNPMRLFYGSIIAFFLVAVEPLVATPAVPCHASESLRLNATHNQFDGSSTGMRYRLHAPSPGVLAVEVLSPSSDLERAEVFLMDNCAYRGEVLASASVLHEIPGGLLLSVDSPGTVWIEVKPRNPLLPLPTFRVHTAFSREREEVDERTWPGADPPQECLGEATPITGDHLAGDHSVILTEIVDERDCDVLELTAEVGGLAWIEAEGAELKGQLFHGATCASGARVTEGELGSGQRLTALLQPTTYRLVIDSNGDGVGSYDLKLRFYDLCSSVATDDHGDTALCATPIELGGRIEGELKGKEWGDEDFFTFQLDESQTLAVVGSEGTQVSLFDSTGRRLFENRLCGGNHPFQVAGRLPPGRYHVRVESVLPSMNTYMLSVESL